MKKLGDIGKIITGNTPKTSDHKNYETRSICFVKPSDIAEDKITRILCSEFYISEYAREKARIVPPESVLVTCIGSIGKVAISGIECAINQQINAIIPDSSKCNAEYLAYLLQYKKSELQLMANAPVVPILNKSQFSELSIELPSLDEQKIVNQRLNKITNIISLRQQQLAKLDELVKARFVEIFGDSEYNTKHWPVVKLSDICEVGSSKRIYKNEQSSSGVPFLRISDLNERIDGKVKNPEIFISIEKYDELKLQGMVPIAGDVLVTSRGTLGRCYIVTEEDVFYFQDGMISWLSKIDARAASLYLSYLFSMRGIQKQIETLQAGSTVAYLSITMLKKLNIMLPPLELQQKFSSFVKCIDKLKLSTKKNIEQMDALKKTLMQQYFG